MTFKMEAQTKNEKTYTRHDVKDTIFSLIIDNETGKTKIVIGNQLMTDKEFANERKARRYIKKKPYELIINIACAMAYNINEINKPLKPKK